MKLNLKPLNIKRSFSGITTQLLQIENFGQFCVLQYHMTPNYYKHKILLPYSFAAAGAMNEGQLFNAFDEYFKNR